MMYIFGTQIIQELYTNRGYDLPGHPIIHFWKGLEDQSSNFMERGATPSCGEANEVILAQDGSNIADMGGCIMCMKP